MSIEIFQSIETNLRVALTLEARARIKPVAKRMGAAIKEFSEAVLREAEPTGEL
jgi:hypothetical protein